MWWTKTHDAKPPNVWLPDYFCNQSADLLRETGAKLTFYPIKRDLEPDWEASQYLLSKNSSPDLFFLVHYFGHAVDGAQALRFCRQTNALLIEDAAHVFVPENGIGKWGDFIFFSPHKLMPTPDGALLLAHTTKTIPNQDSLTLAVVRDPPSNHLAWITKRALQKLMPDWLLRSRIRHLPGFSFDQQPTAKVTSAKISKMGKRLIMQSSLKLQETSNKRKLAANEWRKIFSQASDRCDALFNENDEGSVPYRFVLKCPDETTAITRFSTLRQLGVAVETWPDLPPEVIADPASHETALALRQTLLFLPVHEKPQLTVI